MPEDRLQKLISRAGIASRRRAEELIREGRVTVNGRRAEIGQGADPERDAIKVDGKLLQLPTSWRYLLLNKPDGVVTTRRDPEGRPTVFDLIPPGERRGLKPVGRLDFHTEGLLLLTDDGDLAQRIAHPRYGCTKTYEAKVKGRPAEDELRKLREGIVLAGRRTAPSRIEPLPGRGRRGRDAKNTWWRIELVEGRNRQVREMFRRIGHPVQRLRRVAIGPLSDTALEPGAVRRLTEPEVAALADSTAGGGRSRRS